LKSGANTYPTISSGNLIFLDQIKYLGAPTSLRNYLRTYNLEAKSYFPYQLLTSLDDLKIPISEISYEKFMDILCGNKNLLDRDWREYQFLIEKYGLSEEKALKKLNLDKKPDPGLIVYQKLIEEWRGERLTNLGEILKFYLRFDLVPLLKAVQENLKLFRLFDQNPYEMVSVASLSLPIALKFKHGLTFTVDFVELTPFWSSLTEKNIRGGCVFKIM